ncbi:MAG: YtxH domain-containing protein [Verrucomicrobia bacterium]|nr:YtxH domain-containing protein [Verrucomicrobiota bacterium]
MPFALNLTTGWIGFLAGAVTGALIGLFFHREEWLGGYNSWSRRLLRLGHIACFGLGLINILFALSTAGLSPTRTLHAASLLLVVGMVTMPLNCFLSAWRKPFRHLFFIPAGSTLLGILCLVVSLP